MTSTNPSPAEVFAPGEFIREELDARGWTQADLARILGRPGTLVSGLITGKKRITPQTARDLADAFGTSAELWMSLDAAYQLFQLGKSPRGSIEERAKLYAIRSLPYGEPKRVKTKPKQT